MNEPRGPTPRNTRPDTASWTVAFQVTAAVTERLDRFLADQCAISRTQASRLIGQGAVQVNQATARAGRSLARGDMVEVTFIVDDPPRNIVPFSCDLDIIFEDEHLLVLDKPAGLVVHPAPGHQNDTLVNALVARGTTLSSGSISRPGIVHRLDRDTSGLMVVAKTEGAHRRLSAALACRRIVRTYAALIWGHLGQAVTIDAPLDRHTRDRKRMAVAATGRPALTRVEPIARFEVCDLVRVTLETGRTHQIRVHLAHIGHPILGDPVYGGGGARRVTGSQRPLGEALERVSPRQALHAARLALAHPASGSWLTFQSEWPDDLAELLRQASGTDAVLARPPGLEYLGFFE